MAQICGKCVVDEILANEVVETGELAECDFCGENRQTMPLDVLAPRIGKVFEEFYCAGDFEPYFMQDGEDFSFSQEPDCVRRASIFSRALASGAFLLPVGDIYRRPNASENWRPRRTVGR